MRLAIRCHDKCYMRAPITWRLWRAMNTETTLAATRRVNRLNGELSTVRGDG